MKTNPTSILRDRKYACSYPCRNFRQIDRCWPWVRKKVHIFLWFVVPNIKVVSGSPIGVVIFDILSRLPY